MIAGIPATTPARTALDGLRWLQPHMGLGLADAMAHRGLVDPADLLLRARALAHAPGVRQARRLAALVNPLAESFGESWLRLRIIDAGFPTPRAQIPVLDATGRCVFRLDLGWEEVRVAIEYDGEAHHSTPEQREHDRWRRELLEQTYGWQVLAVGRGEVLGSSLALERAVGELLSLAPGISRRRW